jgi:hypothetical protein
MKRYFNKAQRLRYQLTRHEISEKLSKEKKKKNPLHLPFFILKKKTSHNKKKKKKKLAK